MQAMAIANRAASQRMLHALPADLEALLAFILNF